jgi:hypothetical protein
MTMQGDLVMPKGARKEVVVSVHPEHQKQVKKVIGKLKKKGFVLSESLTGIGVLTGSMPADSVEDLKDVDGVENVQENRKDYTTQQK